jgi:hypothetical protein
MKVHRIGPLFVLSLGACASAMPAGTPVQSDELCGEIARVVCDTNDDCFPDHELEDCLEAQLDACGDVIQPLVDDPRLAYDAVQGGAFVASLEDRAETCWESPVDYDAFVDVFLGTGPAGADCTPARMDATSLRTSALSCAGSGACRLYLRADGSPEGVCEARTDRACSHAVDCGAAEFCSLPDRWQPGVWGDCRPLRADGWSCGSDLECASRFCDGTCGVRPEIDRPLVVSYADLVLASSPIAYLRFERATGRYADATGHGHGAQVVGSVAHAMEGAIGEDTSGAITIAEGQYVVIAEIDALAEAEAFSFELWFQRAEVESSRPILELTDGDDVGVHLWNHARGDQLYANLVDAEGEGHTIASAEGAVSVDAWHHAVLTWDGTTGRLYLDGALVGTVATPEALRLGGDLHVGHRAAQGESPDQYFAGGIDDLAIYGVALDEETIRLHHATGEPGLRESGFPLFGWLAP